MAVFGQVFSLVVSVMSIPIDIYGFSFSLWQVFLWGGFASIALGVIFSVIGGD